MIRHRCLALAALTLSLCTAAHAQWADYGGGPDHSKYVKARDLTRESVKKLEIAWIYANAEERAYQFNPIIVDGVMYVLAKGSSLIAIDVATRKELWIHANLRGITGRGVNYWRSPNGKDRRLIFTLEDTLQAIDARTGKSILSFGTNGVVDLRQGLDRDPATVRRVASSTPGKIFGNLLILGSSPGEAYFSAPGHVRAYDVVTGKLVWTFRTIPRPGEFGYDTWPKDAWKYAGGANVWGEITVDARRGIAYLPVSSPTYDYYGGDRHGMNLFSDCLVAVDARTGKRLWHFQFTHHDLWDYDPTAAPQLLTLRKDGRKIDAVAQATKQGFVFVFDRVTGEPVWPIEERAVPASDVPGERSWPTQPFSTLPPSARQEVRADDLTPYLIGETERAAWKERITKARKGLYTPPALEELAAIPGAVGGTNWGNTASNPGAGILYLLNQDFPSFYRLQTQASRNAAGSRARFGPLDPASIERGKVAYRASCAACHGEDRAGTAAAPSLVSAGTLITFQQLKRAILYGTGRMPPIGHIEDDAISDILAFLGGGARPRLRNDPSQPVVVPAGPVVASGGAPREAPPATAPAPSLENYPEGVAAPEQRYFTDYGLGYPYLLTPPWSTIQAYDLNRGVVLWKKPLGQDRDVAKAGGKGSGVPRGSQRQGMIVTSTGLVFSTARDGIFYCFDAATGEVLWSAPLPMGTEGIPAAYEHKGRTYLVVNATTPLTFGLNSRESGVGSPDPLGKGGYVVFALPK
jgi:quinoprotein glucose dehydrogenase